MNCITIIFVAMVMKLQTSLAINEMYIGQKVFKVIPKTSLGMNVLKNLMDEHETNVWEESCGVGKPMILQVKSQSLKWFKSYCNSHDLTYEELICDLKKAIDETYSFHPFGEPFNYTKYNTFEDIEIELLRLSIQYPDLMHLSVKGESFEKRNLYFIEISENVRYDPGKPIIWIESGAHAREWISIAVGLNFMRTFLEGYGRDANITQMLQTYTFVFVPVLNPDGYVYSWTDDRLWRKNRSINKNSTCRGVDPNRNWNVQFRTVGADPDPCSLTFPGIRPESEPCVRVYAREMRRQQCRIKAYFGFHSFFQLFLIPNSYTRDFPPSFNQNVEVSRAFVSAARKRFNTDYLFGPASILLGAASGVSADYLHDVLKVNFSYIVELRDRGQRGFLLPESEISPNSLEAFDAVIAAIDTIERITNFTNPREKYAKKIILGDKVTYECTNVKRRRCKKLAKHKQKQNRDNHDDDNDDDYDEADDDDDDEDDDDDDDEDYDIDD